MSAAKDPSSIGNLVVELGYCKQCQIQEGLTAMNGAPLGETLVSLGYLTRHQLEWTLAYQGMERGHTNPEEVQAFVKKQHHGLADDLRDITKSVQALTEKINGKS